MVSEHMSVKSLISAVCPSSVESLFKRIERSPIGNRLAKGVFWSMAGVAISRGLMVAAAVLAARILGKTDYGKLGMIQSTFGMFGVFAGFGLGMTGTKYVAEFHRSDPGRAGRIIALSVLVAIVSGGVMALGLFIFAPWLAAHTMDAPQMAGALRIGSLTLFVSALTGAQTGALSGFEAFKTIAYVNLGVGILSFPIFVCGTWFGGLTGAVWALALNMGVNWLLNHVALRKEARRYNTPFTLKKCALELPILWKFSLPAVLSGAMVGPVNWICSALLVNQPHGYGEMGIFSAANQWRALIIFVPAAMSQVILPMLSSFAGLNDQSSYFKLLRITILINIAVCLAVAIPIALGARWIMSSYGPGFREGSWVLVCLALSSVLVALNNVVGLAIVSRGQVWMGLLFNSLWAIALIMFSYIWIRSGHGALGLALANLIAYLLHSIWQSTYAFRLIRTENRRLAYR